MCCKKNSSCSNLSCSLVNAVVVFVSCLFWELHISWVVVLTVNPSVYVELITLYSSEWLAAFSFVVSFYFVVSFDKAVDNSNSSVVQSAATLHHAALVQN